MMSLKTEVPAIIGELTSLRKQIVELLHEYSRLNAMLRDFENEFLAFVLLPSYQLQQTIQLANYLEKEYDRICRALRTEEMTSDEVKSEVKRVMHHADTAFRDPRSDMNQTLIHIGAMQEDVETKDFVLHEAEQRRLMKEFKKIVLPRVHADTSDTPFEVFQTVYEAYKKKDYLMLAAFVAEYRELPPADEELSGFLRGAPALEKEYRAILNGLERRAERLVEESGSQLENVEQVQTQLKKQHLELRNAAVREAERVRLLRNCLQDLAGQKGIHHEVN